MLCASSLRLASRRVALCRPGLASFRLRAYSTPTEEQDVVIIGGGPGGYVAAIRAAQQGLKTTCVEGRGTLGGTCLNVGCIPSKALLQSSLFYHEAKHKFADHGVVVSGVEIDVEGMQNQKRRAVSGLTKGVESLFKKNKVNYVKGWASLAGPNEVKVALSEGGEASLTTKNVIVATGSAVAELPGVPIDEKRIVSSTGALEISEVPGHLVVIGGGVIGLEMGSVWARLGSKVTVVEFLDHIVPSADGEIRRVFQRSLQKQGFEFKLGTKVTGADVREDGVTLTLEPSKGGEQTKIDADIVLVATGRKPYTDNLGLDAVGIETDKRGRIEVDDHFRTKVPSIYAIGDVIPGPMLAHKAEEDGVAAADIISGKAGHVNYDNVPGVIYTHPEVANVGATEEQLKEQGVKYKVGKFPFVANSRAKTIEDSEGLVKILTDAETDRILGAHIIGPAAGENISELVMAIEYGASAEDVARTCHAHPTLSEAVKEAALGAYFKTINA